MHSQAYSYHCISITAACSVVATEVITSVYCYRIAGIFRGVKFSWMLGFVVIRGKTFVVGNV